MIVTDRLRRPSAVDLTADSYKDWLHVNVFDFARRRVALVNVSLHGAPDDPRSLAAAALLVGDVERGWLQHVEVLGADEADVDGVEIVHAPGEGDDTIAAIAQTNRDVVVVTADRELAERVRAANAEVVGPNWLLDQLVD